MPSGWMSIDQDLGVRFDQVPSFAKGLEERGAKHPGLVSCVGR